MGQHGQNGSGHARQAHRTTPCCVLWVPAGHEAPQELLASLERRRLRWVVAGDGYEAMAEVLQRVTSAGAKAAVLVLVDPTRLDLSGLVVDSLTRYGGAVAVWRYDPSVQPVLARAQRHELATVFTRTEEGAVSPRPSPTPPARAEAPPPRPQRVPRAADADDAGKTDKAETPEDREPTAASLLSDEELSMLLADRRN